MLSFTERIGRNNYEKQDIISSQLYQDKLCPVGNIKISPAFRKT